MTFSSWPQLAYEKSATDFAPLWPGLSRPSTSFLLRHSGMDQHQTRNLEIPGSMLRIAPE